MRDFEKVKVYHVDEYCEGASRFTFWKRKDVVLLEDYEKLQEENEELNRELKQIEAQDQVVINGLRKENAKLRFRLDRQSLLMKDEWSYAGYVSSLETKNKTLEKENAKLKCLALHLFERVAFHEFDEWNEILDELCETSSEKIRVKKNRDRWYRIYTRCGRDYHNAKKALKDIK